MAESATWQVKHLIDLETWPSRPCRRAGYVAVLDTWPIRKRGRRVGHVAAKLATWASQIRGRRAGRVAESAMSASWKRSYVGHVAESDTWSARRSRGRVDHVGESNT